MSFLVGRVIHYYPATKSAIVEVQTSLSVGDLVRFVVSGKDIYKQSIHTIQIEDKKVPFAKSGDIVSIKVDSEVKKDAEIYTTSKSIEWKTASDIHERILTLTQALDLSWVKTDKIHCVRSTNANTRAYARIWGLTRIWQQALKIEPQYVIEVITERFDKVDAQKQDEILLHEIAHIPRNFSGSLVPHTRGRKGSFHDKLHEMIHAYHKHK